MCIVSYIPRKRGFILTSNRDIPKLRPFSTSPTVHNINNNKIIFPVDPQGGGSWIATQKNFTGCILNHKWIKKNKQEFNSRGKLLINSLTSNMSYIKKKGFQNKYKPFFFIIISIKEKKYNLKSYSWDGLNFKEQKLDAKKNILWLSNTIYPKSEQKRIKDEFNLLSKNKLTKTDIYNFHLNNIIKEKKDLITGSITQITQKKEQKEITYTDLYTSEQKLSTLKI